MSDYYPLELLNKRLEDFGSARDLTVRIAQTQIGHMEAFQARARAEGLLLIQLYRDRIAGRQAYYDQVAPFVGATRAAKMAEDIAADRDRAEARIAQIFTETETKVASVNPEIDRMMAKAAEARAEYAEVEQKARARHEAWKIAEAERQRLAAEAEAAREQERLDRIQTIHDQNLQWLREARDDVASTQAALDTALEAQANPAQGETRTAAELQQAVDDATSKRDAALRWEVKCINNAVNYRNENAGLELSPVPGVPVAPPADDGDGTDGGAGAAGTATPKKSTT